MDSVKSRSAANLFASVRRCVPRRHVLRSVVSLTAYLCGVWALLFVWTVAPAQALTVASATGYVRVIQNGAQLASLGANRAALISTVAQAVAAPTPAAVAVRMVAGPVGWAALGVTAGLTLAQMYYSQQDVGQIKQVAGTNTTVVTNANGSSVTLPLVNYPTVQYSTTYNAFCGGYPTLGPTTFAGITFLQSQGFTIITGWNQAGAGEGNQYLCKTVGGAPTTQQTTAPATQQQAQDHLAGLPASDPLSIESKTKPMSPGVSPEPVDNETAKPVTPAEMPSIVINNNTVNNTDIVINNNAPAPAGPVTNNSTQNTTTTTTTINNPDGSTTEEETADASVTCTGGEHDQRSFGTVLQQHIDTWKGSGIVGALDLIKNLSWPSTLPVVQLSSVLFGSMSVDFNTWSGVFTALRVLVIAGAGFVAYRIVFVGNG